MRHADPPTAPPGPHTAFPGTDPATGADARETDPQRDGYKAPIL